MIKRSNAVVSLTTRFKRKVIAKIGKETLWLFEETQLAWISMGLESFLIVTAKRPHLTLIYLQTHSLTNFWVEKPYQLRLEA
jgi:hypothetical protein